MASNLQDPAVQGSGASIEEEDGSDNDFEDFGGFEAAEPVAPVEAQPPPHGVQAQPNPWAVFAAAAPNVAPNAMPPDLLQSQNAMAQGSLEPPFPTGDANSASSAHGFGASQPRPNVAAEASDAEFAEYVDHQGAGGQARSFSEQVLEPQFGSCRSDAPVPAGVLDLDLSHRPEGARTPPTNQGAMSPDFDLHASTRHQPPRSPDLPQAGAQEAQSADRGPNHAEVSELQRNLDVANEARVALERELEELTSRNRDLEERLADIERELREQRERYDTVQERHQAEINSVREAGHEALAIIVEEYKELCKTAVLQQQEASERQLREVLEKEAERCRELLHTQNESFKSSLDTEREGMESRLQEALDKQAQQYKEEIQKCIEEEQNKTSETLKKTIQEEQEKAEETLQTALKREREQTKELVQDEKSKMNKLLEEEREKGASAIKEAVEKETEQCKSCIQEAIKEEQRKSEEAQKEVIEKGKEEMKTYLTQQREADAAVRRRHLASLDLFLDGARKHVDMLLSHDQPTDNDKNKNS